MPNFQSFNALSTTGEHSLFARTVIGDPPEESSVIFQTTRGAHVWLDPADQRALIEWLHHQLGDALGLVARKVPNVIYSTCGAHHAPTNTYCVLIGDHEFNGTTAGHCDMNGLRWGGDAQSELFVTGHRCVAVAPESRERCELWTGHKDVVNGARPNHQARSGETW